MFVGLDVHKKYTVAAIVDDEGVIAGQERIENKPELIEAFSEKLSNATVVMESSSTWYWLYEILSKRHKVVLSNPVKTKANASAKLKTDRVDALMLANLLRGGYIAECYVPPKSIREIRALVRHRAALVRVRSTVKNRIHSYLLMNNVRIDHTPFTKGFLRMLGKVEDARIQGYLRVIERLNLEIREASRIVCREAMNDEGARLLMTIPGFSFYSALLVVSEIGDVGRFPDSSCIVCGVSVFYAMLWGSHLPWPDNEDGQPVPEMGSQPVYVGSHESCSGWMCGQVLRAFVQEEGAC